MDTIILNKLEEMQKYYNKEKNAYIFMKEGELLNIEINFNLEIACDINACDIKAWDINARDIKAWDINAWDINARDIKAWDINACDIKAWDIKAWDINACDIKAWDIRFYAICLSYKSLYCNSIKGERTNSKYICLDSEPIIKQKEEEVKRNAKCPNQINKV